MKDPFSELKQLIEEHHLSYKSISAERNELIKDAGSIDTNLYFVKSGSLRVYSINKDEEHCLYFGVKNSLITAVDSFFSHQKSNYCIKAIKKSEIEVIKKTSFMAFINTEKAYLQLWQEVLVQIIQHHIERGQDLFTSSSVERYERLLKRAPELFQEIPHKYIASYLRMSPETLSRLKKS